MKFSQIFQVALAATILIAAPGLAADSYPPYPEKKLYADNDLRGKTAPELTVEKWLTSVPKTKGKVVLLDFWATWCPDCRAVIPELNEFKKKFGNDLVIIAISDEDSKTVKDFMAKHPMDYSIAIDTKKVMKDKIGVHGIPHVLVISPDHIVRWQGEAQKVPDNLTEEKVAQIIAASKAK